MLEQWSAAGGNAPRPSAGRYLRGWIAATQRNLVKRHVKARVPQHRNNPDYQRNRYQGISPDELSERIERLGRCLGRFHDLRAEPVAEHIYRIAAPNPGQSA